MAALLLFCFKLDEGAPLWLWRNRTSGGARNAASSTAWPRFQLGTGTLPRDCLVTDLSTGGVRLHVEGFEVPDDFVLLLSGEGVAKECNYQVRLAARP